MCYACSPLSADTRHSDPILFEAFDCPLGRNWHGCYLKVVPGLEGRAPGRTLLWSAVTALAGSLAVDGVECSFFRE